VLSTASRRHLAYQRSSEWKAEPRPTLDELTYAEYLHSPEWLALRERVRKRDGYRCRICNSAEDLNVHHREYPRRWSEDNETHLTTTCWACHQRHHHQDGELRALRHALVRVRAERLIGWLVAAAMTVAGLLGLLTL
jgi:5-methylcytosine-specific restriction endonuclease McrA